MTKEMIDEKALAAAIEHCDAVTADDCRGVVAAYEAAKQASIPKDIVERVRFAIADAMNRYGPMASDEVARAALAAMREPVVASDRTPAHLLESFRGAGFDIMEVGQDD